MPKPPENPVLPLKTALERRATAKKCLDAAMQAGAMGPTAQLLNQLRLADIEVVRSKDKKQKDREQVEPNLTPEQAADALVETVVNAPLRVKYTVYQRLLQNHPEWAEE